MEVEEEHWTTESPHSGPRLGGFEGKISLNRAALRLQGQTGTWEELIKGFSVGENADSVGPEGSGYVDVDGLIRQGMELNFQLQGSLGLSGAEGDTWH